MSATLGGLLKDYRLQKNLSQMEIAFALGWKEPSRLSRIEQGKVGNPPRELLNRIMEVMELKEEEKSHLLLVGNYLPTKEEIDEIRRKIDSLVRSWPYPAIVYDFSWRIIHHNKVTSHVYQNDASMEKRIREKNPWLIEILFDPDFIMNRLLKGRELQHWHNFLLRFVIHYKYSQRTRTKEKWYIDLIKRLMNNNLFRETWQRAQDTKLTEIAVKYGMEPLIHPEDDSKRLNFHIFAVPVLTDPRIDIEFDVPADIETYKYFQKKRES